MIPAELGVTIDKALQVSADLIKAYQSDYNTQQIVNMARALEGMPRHASIHAAGVVIGKESLSQILPLQKTPEGHIVTQYTKETVEDIGLLKMDILGLRTLTVIDRAVEIIRHTRKINLDMDSLPLDDPEVYRLLSGDTIGVFQLESDGLRRILKDLAPSRFQDLIAVIALYRPGPLGSRMVEFHQLQAPPAGDSLSGPAPGGYTQRNLWGYTVSGTGHAYRQRTGQFLHGGS